MCNPNKSLSNLAKSDTPSIKNPESILKIVMEYFLRLGIKLNQRPYLKVRCTNQIYLTELFLDQGTEMHFKSRQS